MVQVNKSTIASTAGQAAADRAAAVVPALLAALFGALILWGVGFAAPDIIHNAAHDGRHAHAFPCH